MTTFPYTGSGPYCYANSFAMMFGKNAPSTAVIEFATSSPFGMQLVGGALPFFDPYGWDPEAGFDDALMALGWISTVTNGDNAVDSINRLKTALTNGPVWIGPVEMGYLRHQPGKTGPIGADHYIVVLDINDDTVLIHDPQGYPYVSLPLLDFLNAWQAETISYGTSFTMRTDFIRVEEKSDVDIIKASIPAAIRWLSMNSEYNMPENSFGNGEAAKQLAVLIENDCNQDLLDHLIHFAVRVGTRRVADAATCLSLIGYNKASMIMTQQAHLIGSLQYPLVTGDYVKAANALRELAPTYDELLKTLKSETK
ncbi:hypothetical protein GSM42_13310 [Shimazuella sp. KC615]|uniref:RADC family protein n=1 Tax=Shimazuella alba TaxID=2690964 RepID=A0A6I4VXS1_9BACL|nr:hypothetical protein [Shimazuella alba]